METRTDVLSSPGWGWENNTNSKVGMKKSSVHEWHNSLASSPTGAKWRRSQLLFVALTLSFLIRQFWNRLAHFLPDHLTGASISQPMNWAMQLPQIVRCFSEALTPATSTTVTQTPLRELEVIISVSDSHHRAQLTGLWDDLIRKSHFHIGWVPSVRTHVTQLKVTWARPHTSPAAQRVPELYLPYNSCRFSLM